MSPPSTARISVLLVDTQGLVRAALASLLDAAEGVCVNSVASLADAWSVIQRARPDVVVFRQSPAGVVPREPRVLLSELPRICQATRTIVITATPDLTGYARLLELGAVGVMSCEDAGDALIRAVHKVHAGEIWLDRTRTAQVVATLVRKDSPWDLEAAKVESLTARQHEIVALVAEGLSNRQLADRLFISEATVRNHMTAILDKLQLRDRSQLTVFAFRRGLVA